MTGLAVIFWLSLEKVSPERQRVLLGVSESKWLGSPDWPQRSQVEKRERPAFLPTATTVRPHDELRRGPLEPRTLLLRPFAREIQHAVDVPLVETDDWQLLRQMPFARPARPHAPANQPGDERRDAWIEGRAQLAAGRPSTDLVDAASHFLVGTRSRYTHVGLLSECPDPPYPGRREKQTPRFRAASTVRWS